MDLSNRTGKKRIFWLGMHKVLVQTELVRLRELGFEVFNPAYLSPYKDQSANMEWDHKQPTTLPRDVFERLSNFNFFYNEIPTEISDLLNRYFDAVIVTISFTWLDAVLSSGYIGKVIYRTYGQPYSLSDKLKAIGQIAKISSHSDFAFMPHASETLDQEHAWFREMAQVTPYCLTEDVFAIKDTWGTVSEKRREIMLTCPVIKNIAYAKHYKFLKKHFHEPHYKYYGGQHSKVRDPQVVGTLPRKTHLERFQAVSGYLYTYQDPNVCYLPPIEMMVIGGPVLFLTGSLLDRFFDKNAPGRCHSIEEAKEKADRLLNGDKAFIDALIESQKEVRKRYSPEYVWPIFDQTMIRNLEEKVPPQNLLVNQVKPSPKERIYLLHHFPLPTIRFKDHQYIAFDGIVRVMRAIVEELSRKNNIEVVITAWYDDADLIAGYFNDFNKKNENLVRVLVINNESDRSKIRHLTCRVKSIVKKYAPDFMMPLLNQTQKMLNSMNHFYMNMKENFSRKALLQPKSYSEIINRDPSCKKVIVPHYSFFPDAMAIEKDIYLYLPDYMPHFFHKTGEFKKEEGRPTEVGKAIVDKAKVVFCNSHFTKNYLPDSRLKVDPQKINVFYLPHLNKTSDQSENKETLPDVLTKQRYIFYPTQARPNKNLSLLLEVFNELVSRGHELELVLTATPFSIIKKMHKTFRSLPTKTKEKIHFMDGVSDGLLETLYRNAALLCFTSLAEGNFPPQIQEALSCNTPIVASDLKFISERIPKELAGSIRLCEPNNLMDFVNGCEEVLNNREQVLEMQNKLYNHIRKDEANFSSSVTKLFASHSYEQKQEVLNV